jgi:hypothetical protein
MKIRGIANWASILVPNTRFDPVYCIDLTITEDQAKDLKKQGLKPKQNAEGEWIIKFKRKVFKKDGTYADKPALVDANLNPVTTSVGNGSEVIVQYSVYEWSNNFGAGTGSDLSGVQIINLVEFKAGDGAEFEKEDGFTSTSPAEAKAVKEVPVPAKAGDDDGFDDDIPF